MSAWFRQWFSPIRALSTESHVPGLVTLEWTTPDPTPTRVSGPDGDWLFDQDTPEVEHCVTLAGTSGSEVEVRIHVDGLVEPVQVRF